MGFSSKRCPAYSKLAKRLVPDDAQTVFEIEPELIIYLFSLHKPRDNVTGFGFCGNRLTFKKIEGQLLSLAFFVARLVGQN